MPQQLPYFLHLLLVESSVLKKENKILAIIFSLLDAACLVIDNNNIFKMKKQYASLVQSYPSSALNTCPILVQRCEKAYYFLLKR